MTTRFPADAPIRRVVRALAILGFQIVREREYISMLRRNPDGSETPLTVPNHSRIKASTLRRICTQAGVPEGRILGSLRPGVVMKKVYRADHGSAASVDEP